MLYTMGDWFVKPGREDEFVAAWRDLAEWTALEIGPEARAMLLRDRNDPSRFTSFGPWDDEDRITAWRESEGFGTRIERIRPLIERFEPHTLDAIAGVGASLP